MSKIKYPPLIQWEVTSFCNHDCIHCYNYWRSEDTKKSDVVFNNEITEDHYLNIAKKIVESNPIRVIITGGEPLSVFQKIKSSIDLLLKNNIIVSINTNATLINDEILNYLTSRKISLLVSFPCCKGDICDKITGVGGSFDRIVNSIKKIRKNNIPITVNMVVSKVNYDYIYDTALFVKNELKLDNFCVTKAGLPINSKEQFRPLLLSKDEFTSMLHTLIRIKNELGLKIDSLTAYCLCGYDEYTINEFGGKRKCNAGRTSFAITCDGDIKACARDSEVYGNILDVPFDAAIDKMSKWYDGTLIPAECKDCKNLKNCGAGCRLETLSLTGNINSLDETANLDNKDVDFNADKDFVFEDRVYLVNKDNRFIKENNYYRVNFGAKYNYISQEFYKFLSSVEEFTLQDLMNQFHITRDEAIIFLTPLIKNRIVL